jgi:mRNA-degrading endonuclease RelE of RelBE toxin-antitoxin system
VSDINIQQMPAFKKAYKKLSHSQQLSVNNAIKEIVINPQIGNEKRGDLSGVFVYKFKIHHQEFLLAYQWDAAQRLLLALGLHENFYRDLKNR